MKRKVDPEFAKYIAIRLKTVRNEQNLSQAKLAEVSGVSLSNIQRIEGAKGDTTFATAYHLSKALNVTYLNFLKAARLQYSLKILN